jgi:chromosome partitioning protein
MDPAVTTAPPLTPRSTRLRRTARCSSRPSAAFSYPGYQLRIRPQSASATTMKIPIINRKGGVAKSTTAINLGAALAQAQDLGLAHRDYRTLILDLDPQASTSYALTGGSEDKGPNLGHVLIDGLHIEDAIRSTATPNLHVIAASETLADEEELVRIALPVGASDEQRARFLRRFRTRLRDALEMLQTPIDVVLFDCPAGIGLPLALAMTAGERFLIPSKVDRLGRLSGFLDRLIALRAGSPYPMARILGILLTDLNYQLADTADREAAVRATYGPAVLDTVIRRNVTIERAQEAFRTIFQEDPQLRSSGAHSYRDLAAELLLRSVGAGVNETDLSDDVRMRGTRLGLLHPATEPAPA